jgi:hypothetical protein
MCELSGISVDEGRHVKYWKSTTPDRGKTSALKAVFIDGYNPKSARQLSLF